MGTTWSETKVAGETARLEGLRAPQIVAWALDEFGAEVAIASSFSKEDVALIDLASRSGRPFRIIALDTGRLHEETCWVAEQVQKRYKLTIEWHMPHGSDVEAMIRENGMYSFRRSLEDRKSCCELRKVRPLRRALAGAPAWMTGLRRSQGVTRGDLPPLEWDRVFGGGKGEGGMPKVNPLFNWSDHALEDYVREQHLPKNPLYAQGYQSIGCAPCTRPVAEGQHARSGRWWWEDPTNAECGLHPAGHVGPASNMGDEKRA